MKLKKTLKTTQNSEIFHQIVLNWFQKHGRKSLPWQQNKTPYRVWVSEIMLQQTQVSTVIPYYERFMQQFPDIASLANAHEDEVLHFWTGLGYYTRARNLHKTAKIIQEKYRGIFPNTIEDIQDLPGIGRSTAGAILSIAFKKRSAILDGNVKRVLIRFLGLQKPLKEIMNELWQHAENFTPLKNPDKYAQAMMDLGATICVRSKPLCEKCPLEKICIARKNNLENSLPLAAPKKSLRIKQTTLCFIQHNKNIFLQKNAARGIWGGLWCPLQLEEHLSAAEIKKQLKNFSIHTIKLLPTFRHTFTHFHLDILPVVIIPKKPPTLDNAQQLWYNLEKPQAIGLPAPIEKLLRSFA